MRPSTMLKSDAYGVLCKLNIDKGLGQGDPLSPYLFVFVVEALNCLLEGLLAGIPVNVDSCRTILELKVNSGKSELILNGRVDNMEELTLEIGCKGYAFERKARWEQFIDGKYGEEEGGGILLSFKGETGRWQTDAFFVISSMVREILLG
ncbi:hypothetical protein CK203_017137 [Vitis vinifera]|uniref:Reverse transcriptase domain-containing protein n=1 Tax=Vitis vinifera TaxID=29760 RepID=A0A438JZR2_VITVI|nr:hypothetical protein CK203_017137 [Vitis vinifera]